MSILGCARSEGRIFIETGRLIVRTMRPEHVEPIAALWTDPATTAYLGGPSDLDSVRQSLCEDLKKSAPPAFDLWPTFEKDSGLCIGNCGPLDKEIEGRQEIELVYVIPRRAWGQGFATEAGAANKAHALITLSCDRLVALIHSDNLGSQRVATKLGFKFEREIDRPHGLLLLYGLIQSGQSLASV